MAVTVPRTRAGLIKFRPVRRGARVALVAPASPFDTREFQRGLDELKRLGFEPVYDESIFEREAMVAGPAALRSQAFQQAMTREDVDAVIAVRGGYGSAEILAGLDARAIAHRRTAFVGYSDLTSVHAYLNADAHLASVHGPMIDGRLARGTAHYDEASFLAALGSEPMGELSVAGVEAIKPGEASGPLFGGTITQIAASLGTPYAFATPPGAVLFLEDVGERPYRIRRALTQLGQSGVFVGVRAVVIGQMPQCEEPRGTLSVRDVVADYFAEFRGPVLFGFPSGHTTSPLVTLPFGVETRVIATGRPRLVVEEAAAA